MNRYQKLAWWNLIVITLTIIITTTAVAIELHIRGFSTIAPWFVAILALLKFNPYLFKKPQGQDKVVSDERDEFIIKRAVSFAYTTFWIVFFVSSFAVKLSRSSQTTLSWPCGFLNIKGLNLKSAKIATNQIPIVE